MMRHVAGVCVLAAATGCMTPTSAEDPLPGPIQNAGVFAMEGTEERELLVSVLLTGDPSEVWPWITEGPMLVRWFCEEVRTDASGAVGFAWPSRGLEMTGRELAGSDLSLDLSLDPYGRIGPTKIRFELQPGVAFTRLLVTQWPFPASAEGDSLADEHRAGWERSFARLRVAHETGLPTEPAPPPGT